MSINKAGIISRLQAFGPNAPNFGALPSKAEYIKEGLVAEMTRHRGRKRLRKKKSTAVLALRWTVRLLASPISRRIDYAAVGRGMFLVEPLPQATP